MHDSLSSVEKIQSALSFVSPQDRDVWVKMAMAVKSELGQDGEWVWMDWSKGADNFNDASAKSVWKGVKPGGKVGIGSLFYEAKQAGWTWDKPERKLSAEELAAIREASRLKAEAAAAEKAAEQATVAERALAIWNAAEPATTHPYLVRKQVKAHCLRVGKWEIVDSETGEVRLITPLALLVPIKDRTGKLWSLQAIFPRKMMGGRDKDYLAGGAKAGHFHAIGKPQERDGRKVFVIVEGYATGASIHESTGHCVLVTFDTSNLLPVASAIRERQPDAIILFAADNDQFTQRKDGTPYNPGVEAANKAAAEVQGLVAVPQFVSLDDQPTDFNDLYVREGADAVVAQIAAAMAGPVVEHQPDPEPEASPPWEGPASFEQLAEQLAPEPDEQEADTPAIPQDELDELNHLVKNKYFTILGHEHENYYIFVHSKQQVIERTIGSFNEVGLVQLANDINWWEMNFPKKGGFDTKLAASWIDAVASSRGVYDPSIVRGRGAWTDSGRAIYHLGDRLLEDGKEIELNEISSSYVYTRGKKMPRPASVMLTKEEGLRILDIAKQVRWSMQGSSVLVTGWVFLSSICGALKWRPHIWITGAAGSGKTTVMHDFCFSLTRGISLPSQGDSTEAGIRQKLSSDALPVLIDEFETNDEREKARVDGIIAMIRKASSETEAETYKGTTGGDGVSFKVRSMFCLASINTKLDKQADNDRITKLTIRVPPKDGSQVEHWRKLEADLYSLRDDETIPTRLMARSITMIPTVLATVRVFVKVAAAIFKSQRTGDQYGTLIAGCWCMTNDHVPSEQEAEALISAYNWDEHTEDKDQDDSIEALNAVMGSKVRLPAGLGDVTVFELIRDAHSVLTTGEIDEKEATKQLHRIGIIVKEKEGFILFGNSIKALKDLVKNTAFSSDLRGQLLRLPGATRWNNRTERFLSAVCKCVAVPVSLVFGEMAGTTPPSASAPAGVPEDFPI